MKRHPITRFSAILFALFVLSACTQSPQPSAQPSTAKKTDRDHYYRFKELAVEVRTPKNCLLDMFTYEGERAVGFMTGRGRWRIDGYYELQVWDRPHAVRGEVDFFKNAYKVSKDYIRAEGQRRKMRLQWQSMEFLDEFAVPAFQTLGIDPDHGRVLASFALHEHFIMVVSLQYPNQSPDGEPAQLPLQCYNRFLESVREIN